VDGGIQCRSPGGGGSGIVVVSVSGLASRDMFIFNYDAPIVTSIVPPNGLTEGGTRLTVFGSNFGPYNGVEVHSGSKMKVQKLAVSIGDAPCTVVERTGKDDPKTADSQLICVTPKGVGSCANVAVSSGTKTSEGAFLYSFRGDETVTFAENLNKLNLINYVGLRGGKDLNLGDIGGKQSPKPASLIVLCKALNRKRCAVNMIADYLTCSDTQLSVASPENTEAGLEIDTYLRTEFKLDSKADQAFLLFRADTGGPPSTDVIDTMQWADGESQSDFTKRVLAWVKEKSS